jgi:hypothetical protein
MTKHHFAPVDEREHAQACAGKEVDDRCRYCGHPFMDHNNGACPTPEEEPLND